MSVAAILIFIISVYFLLLNIISLKNKYIHIIIMYFICCACTLIISMLYTSAVSKYSSTVPFDMSLLFFFSKYSIHVTALSNLYNFSVGLFMLSSVICVISNKRTAVIGGIPMLIIIAAFLCMNDSDTTWNVFIALNTGKPKPFLAFIYDNLGIINNLIIAFYMIIPIIFFQRNVNKTKLHFMKTYYNALSVGVLIIDIYYMLVLNTFFKAIRYFNLSLAKLPETLFESNINGLHVLITFAVIITITLPVFYYHPFNSFVISPRRDLENDVKNTSANLSMVLHTYKNSFLSMGRIASTIEENIDSNNPELILSCAQTLKAMSSEQLDIINKTLSMTGVKKVVLRKINVADIINDTLNEMHIPADIKLTVENSGGALLIMGDAFYLKEVFKNLIENSITSLRKSSKADTIIKIRSYTDNQFIFVEFFDNGCGISKEEIKKIYNLYHSSKPRRECGGIGLYFVRNIINMHHGRIETISKPGEYTTFSIVLQPANKIVKKGDLL